MKLCLAKVGGLAVFVRIKYDPVRLNFCLNSAWISKLGQLDWWESIESSETQFSLSLRSMVIGSRETLFDSETFFKYYFFNWKIAIFKKIAKIKMAVSEMSLFATRHTITFWNTLSLLNHVPKDEPHFLALFDQLFIF